MTPQERQILEEAEQQAFETSVAYNEPRSSGIRPEPVIEETETTLDGQPFGLDFSVDPVANVLPGASVTQDECPSCPSDSVTIQLSGVTICSGCIPLEGAFAGSSSLIITSGSIDGTYVLPGGGFGVNGCCYELITDATFAVDVYETGDCSGDPIPQEFTLVIWAGRYQTTDPTNPCQWTIYAWIEGPDAFQILVFLGEAQTSFSTPFNNAAVCGGGDGTFNHPCSIRSWEAVGAEEGTATLSE